MKMPKFIVENNTEKYEGKPFYLKILEGPCEGMEFTLGKIEFLGEDEEGNGKISFDYDLLFTPESISIEEHKELIEQNITDVLVNILEDMTTKEKNETGNTDSEQSD
jgi:hypothetical protein